MHIESDFRMNIRATSQLYLVRKISCDRQFVPPILSWWFFLPILDPRRPSKNTCGLLICMGGVSCLCGQRARRQSHFFLFLIHGAKRLLSICSMLAEHSMSALLKRLSPVLSRI